MSNTYPAPDQIIIRTSKWAIYQKAVHQSQKREPWFEQDGRWWIVDQIKWNDSAPFEGRTCEIELTELVSIQSGEKTDG